MYYSQHGEDSFIDNYIKENNLKIINRIVDVGAGDGTFLSNSRFFIESKRWEAYLIEGQLEQCNQMLELWKDKDMVHIMNAIVAEKVYPAHLELPHHWSLSTLKRDDKFTQNNNLTKTLSNMFRDLKIKTCGILSVDIEGMDVKVIEEFLLHSICRPQIIIIEGNTIEERIKEKSVIEKEGYKLINTLNVNQIFIKKELC